MYHATRQPPLKEGRRISVNVNLAPSVLLELSKIAGGNRSAAIEALVREHVARRQSATA
jgi:hypothetical protein